jgi:DHA1 family bicyclomycin/chloramphenicol resistance-like MFS transporter
MGLAPILAPLAGGQLVGWTGWRGIFVLMMTLGAIVLITVICIMKESLAPERMVRLSWRNIGHNYLTLLRHRGFLAHSLAGGFGQAGMFAYIVASPRVFIELYGVDPRYYGLLFGLNACGLILGAQISAHLLRHSTPLSLQGKALTALACVSLTTAAITLTGWLSLPLLMICLISYMFSQGFVNPNSAALALAEQGKRLGAASAMMGTLQMSCGAAAGLVVSLWQANTALPLTAVLCGCACLSWGSGRIARMPA